MFYEFDNSLSADEVKIESGYDFNFPEHLHGSFEIITVTAGEMTVLVDGTEYLLYQNQALLIFPNQVHSLKTEKHSRHYLCIFSPKLVQAYGKVFRDYVPKNNIYKGDYAIVERLMNGEQENILSIKGALYSLCGEFDRYAEYEHKNSGNERLLVSIFHFVEQNYGGECTLSALSEHTAYNYEYLSKFFTQRTGVSFTEYVNRYRVSEACYQLQNGEQTVLKTAYDCGFESLRSFNRNFKRILGMTPCEYRAKFKK